MLILVVSMESSSYKSFIIDEPMNPEVPATPILFFFILIPLE